MDNLTHSLVGLFLARAGFRHAAIDDGTRPGRRATAIMVLAANIPDVDVISWLGGGAAYVHYHRNITHSLSALPLMALLAVALVRGFSRTPIRWLKAWLISLVAVASHLILDLTNIYGVRLLLPFSDRWFQWDTTPIVDIGILAIILLGVAAPALTRLVGAEIGERNKDAGKAGWAVTALFLLSAWDYSRGIVHDRAITIMRSHIYNGLAARRVAVLPSQNPLRWTGIAELSNAFVEVPIDLRGEFHATDEQTWIKPPRTPAVDAALQTFPFQRLLEFVQWPLWVVEPNRVTLIDLRFGSPRNSLFAASAIFDEQGHLIDSKFGTNPVRQR